MFYFHYLNYPPTDILLSTKTPLNAFKIYGTCIKKHCFALRSRRSKASPRRRNHGGKIKRKKWKFTWKQAQRVWRERRVAFICATRNLWGKSQTKRKRMKTCPRINKTSGALVLGALSGAHIHERRRRRIPLGPEGVALSQWERLSRPDAQQHTHFAADT